MKEKNKLPKEVVIPINELYLETDDEVEDQEVMSDVVGDYLSDVYGYCVNNFKYKVNYGYDENGHKFSKTVLAYKINWDTKE